MAHLEDGNDDNGSQRAISYSRLRSLHGFVDEGKGLAVLLSRFGPEGVASNLVSETNVGGGPQTRDIDAVVTIQREQEVQIASWHTRPDGRIDVVMQEPGNRLILQRRRWQNRQRKAMGRRRGVRGGEIQVSRTAKVFGGASVASGHSTITLDFLAATSQAGRRGSSG